MRNDVARDVAGRTPPLILASTSIYRKALLARLSVPFEVMPSQVDELSAQGEETDPAAIAVRLARAKAEAAWRAVPGANVIGSDQVAAIDGRVLGKPGSREKAFEQLTLLAGRSHELLTAVCLLGPQGERTHLDRTVLTMCPLSAAAVMRSIDRDHPFDCAGSYRIEAGGIGLFERIDGEDESAIVGLPLLAVARMLRAAGYEIP